MGTNYSNSKESAFVRYKEDPGMPSRNLFERFFHEKRLRDFFCVLSQEGIHDLDDLARYTEKQVLEIAPLPNRDKRALKAYVKKGFLEFKPE